MIPVRLRFYGNLNALLSKGRQKKKSIKRRLPTSTSVKDLIEGCGIPHTEVDFILANNKAVDFSYLVTDNDRISIYPIFYNLIDEPPLHLQPQTLSSPLFLVDVNLGKLARYLRLTGFDTAYQNNIQDDALITQMQKEDRILLTRDRKLLMRKVVQYGYLPRSDDPVQQLQEVLERFNLFDDVDAFSRCPRCNGSLQKVAKDDVLSQLETLTKRHYDTFSQCPDCKQVYWPGSHRRRLPPKLQKLLDY